MTLATPVPRPPARKAALAAWDREVTARLAAFRQVPHGREEAMDARRQREALERTQDLVGRLRRQRHQATTGPSVVLVHRSPWVRQALAGMLADAGASVVGEAEDGASGLAFALVEQPELVLLEDHLPWLPALELISTAREFAPGAVLVVQAEDDAMGQACVDAGATAAFARRLPLPDLARRSLSLLESA